jgi:hypothetical protein
MQIRADKHDTQKTSGRQFERGLEKVGQGAGVSVSSKTEPLIEKISPLPVDEQDGIYLYAP